MYMYDSFKVGIETMSLSLFLSPLKEIMEEGWNNVMGISLDR